MSRTTDYKFRATVAVKASRIEAARDWWKENIDPDGVREDMFSARLSGDGSEPPTWYAMQTSLRAGQLKAVNDLVSSQPDSDVRLITWPTKYARKSDLEERFVHNSPKVRVLDNESVTFQDLLDSEGLQSVRARE